MQNPIPVDAEDLQRFRDYLKSRPFADTYGNNARPPQPLNGRQIFIGEVGDITTEGPLLKAFPYTPEALRGP